VSTLQHRATGGSLDHGGAEKHPSLRILQHPHISAKPMDII
jgi:hypothetical protein